LSSNALFFYEDLPYGQFVGGPDNVKRTVHAQYPHLSEINVSLTTAEMNKKLRAMDLYKSQLHPSWRKDIEYYGSALGVRAGDYGERYWAPADLHQSFYSFISS
jgi:hypothetical protein